MADESGDNGLDRAGKAAFAGLEQPKWPAGDGEMARQIRAFDWSATPLGPTVGWPQTLKIAVDLMLDSAFPTYVWWGPDLIQFYNDPAIEINGTKHPGLLGTAARKVWLDLWGGIGELAEKVLVTGRPERGADIPMVPDRSGPAETVWFTFSYSALRNEDGLVSGIFITGTETTERMRAGAALRASEQQFESLLNQAPLGVYLVDSGLVIRNVNTVALPVFGDIPGGPVGRNFDEVIHILWEKEFADEVVSIFRQALKTGESYVTAERAEYRHDRNVFEYYEWRVDRISLPGGEHGVVCYFRDISEGVHARHEIEKARSSARASDERQAFLLKLSDALRPLGDALEVQSAALRVLGEHLRVNRAFFNEVDEKRDAYVIHRSYANGVAPLTGQFRLSDIRHTAELAGSGQIVVIEDTSTDPRLSEVERATYAAMEAAAGIGVPLIKDGRWVAGLGVHHATPRHWTPDDIDLVRETAERTWAAVERAQAETALHSSEARYRALFETIDSGFCIIEILFDDSGRAVDYRFVESNPAFERQSGLFNAVGRRMREFAPDLEDHWFERYGRVALTGEPMRVEGEAAPLGRWFDINAFRVGKPEQRRVAVLFTDITARRHAEAAMLESEARQAFLLKFSDVLRPLGDPVEVQNAALRVLGQHLGAVRAQYWEVEPDGQHAHSEGGYAKDSPCVSGRFRLNDFGVHVIEAFAAGLTVAVRDVTTDPLASEQVLAAHDAVGVRAHITVPLVKGGRLVALLAIHHTDARDWTHPEIAVAEEAAERTWAALERAQAEAALRKSEERLRTMFDSIDEGFMEVEVVMSADGRAVDWRFLTLNASFERLTGLPDITGMLVSELLPDLEPEWAERYAQVVNTGEALRFELPASGLGRWFDVYLARVGDADSRRVAVVYNDVTDRKQAEMALRESEARQKFLLKFSDALRAEPSAGAMTERALRMLFDEMRLDRCYVGIYRLAEDSGEFPHQVHDDRLPPLPAKVRLSDFPKALEVASERTLVINDLVKMDGLSDDELASFAGLGMGALIVASLRKGENNPLWAIVAVSATPRVWTPGEILLVEEVAERTWAAAERARTEAALRESEERFAQFAASSTDVLWIRRADTMEMEFLSPAFATVYGIDPQAALGAVQHWAALIVPEDRDVALGHLESARRGQATVHEFRIRRPSDGTFRWIKDHGFPLFDENGVKWVGGIGTDVTEAKLLAEHQSVLMAELQHRVRNIMAIIRAVITRTAATASSIADYEKLMIGRLMAMARTQTLLTRAAKVGVDLGALVRDEIEAQAHHNGQYVLSGPEVVISPKAAEVLSLAVHELATNALKYGALSGTDGKIEVNWQVLRPDGLPHLRLDWTERRPAPPDWSPPMRRGFGTQLIEQRVPYELQGRGKVEIRAEGCHAFIEFPLQPGASILETNAPTPGSVFGGSIDMAREPSLAGQTVLVLEDDFYLAQDAASALRSAGAEVLGPYATAADAIDATKRVLPTAAVLDVNLGTGPSFDVAHALRNAGTPFVFMTGYDRGAVPEQFAAVSRLQKPVEPRHIVREIAALIEAR